MEFVIGREDIGEVLKGFRRESVCELFILGKRKERVWFENRVEIDRCRWR